ncbi:MAG TPA: tannase/feruloyl esterase family alpha/beta hydrolase [Nocardioidaceae bacterium]|nr:tannase/feruloyl esterase family alpha/beta hydrolase [Nocardioidaceae bacterium]
MRPPVRRIAAAIAASVPILALPVAASSATVSSGGVGTTSDRPADRHCARMQQTRVKGAEKQVKACLDDLTTAGTVASGHTDPNDWAGLHAPGTENPSGVPGIQIDGYFPDTSTFNQHHGWDHDSQFVLRLPDDWNGGLVVSGAPGVRTQYANDFIIGDWVLARGYAFASTDKGNSSSSFYTDGNRPGDAIAEWHRRVSELAVAAKHAVKTRYRQEPQRTYMFGISNGGYLTRWQLENRPDLFDGGVDWEGTLFTAPGPHLLTYLPAALEHYPAYAATGDDAAHDAMIAAGFQPGSEFLWPYHYSVYWDLTQRIYREELDPAYDGDLQAGIPFCQSGTPNCDADYDYAARPEAVHEAMRRVSLDGDLERPMLTLHGTRDALLPIRTDSDVYDAMIDRAGASDLHRYYRVEDGTHVDSLYATYPDRLRPLLPCAREAFAALEGWVENGAEPPADATIARPRSGDLVNTCALR